ncbi:MAG: cysteine desulfurase [Myxococcales bacterium]|nr:cysteine desulfurase [Myxococcales bacterium]
MRIYLDYNASAPVLPEVVTAVLAATSQLGNPSSIHAEGRATRQLVEHSRAQVAQLLDATSDEVVFTSGGTEAIALGAIGLARCARDRGAASLVLVCATVHPAVRGALAQLALEGFQVQTLPVDEAGRLQPFAAARAALVAISAANHETGVVQPLAQVRAWAGDSPLFVDAVQWAGKRALSEVVAVADAASISAHKFGGPKGVGALWVKAGWPLAAVMPGGNQERQRRPGTENLAGIAGMAAAAKCVPARLALAGEISAVAASLEASARAIAGAHINGGHAERIGNTVNVRFDGARGDAIAMALDVAGIAVSNGAACTSGSVKPSPVLLAMGQDDAMARAAVRFSLGPGTTQDDVRRVMEVLPGIVARARQFG